MRIPLIIVTLAILLAIIASAPAADSGKKDDAKSDEAIQNIYEINLDRDKKARITTEHPGPGPLTGVRGGWIGLDFEVNVLKPELAFGPKHVLIIREDGVERLRIPLRKQGDLTIILAMDSGGSMREGGKMTQAKKAADEFLGILHENADPGLIVFNDKVLTKIEPLGNRDPNKQKSHRDMIKQAKDQAVPGGGTGYLDATHEAITMLKKAKGNRAIVIITDGLDRNKTRPLKDVIKEANNANVQVYTIGVGAGGYNVSGVLVVDHSGSMARPATEKETKTKIEALREAACVYVDQLRAGVPVSLQSFSTQVEPAGPFTENKEKLKSDIRALQPGGGTQLYDAMYAGVMTLAATYPEGKRRMIVMTDGVDEAPGSRHRYEEVIELAQKEGVLLHLVGFGRENEINKKVMQEMAEKTDGTFTHADSAEKLDKFYKDQVVETNQEGIDKESLTKLAEGTGGRYSSAEDASKLTDVMKKVTLDADRSYHPVFESLRPVPDGMLRGVTIEPFDESTGKILGRTVETAVHTHGVVPPGLDWRVYLAMLMLLAGLLIVPAGFRRLTRPGRA